MLVISYFTHTVELLPHEKPTKVQLRNKKSGRRSMIEAEFFSADISIACTMLVPGLEHLRLKGCCFV